jgi:hypothetical protein
MSKVGKGKFSVVEGEPTKSRFLGIAARSTAQITG